MAAIRFTLRTFSNRLLPCNEHKILFYFSFKVGISCAVEHCCTLCQLCTAIKCHAWVDIVISLFHKLSRICFFFLEKFDIRLKMVFGGALYQSNLCGLAFCYCYFIFIANTICFYSNISDMHWIVTTIGCIHLNK